MQPRIQITCLLLALAAGTALWAQTAADQPPAARVSFGAGFDYSRGDYGFAEDTEVFSVPFNATYETGRWLLRATVPWLTIRGPAAVIGGTTGGPGRPDASESSGLGDTYLSVTRRFAAESGWETDVSGRVKLPTADDDRGLGTGEVDSYAQADVRRTFGAVTPFVSAGYRILGDNTRYQLQDGVYASGGAYYRTSDTTVVGASLDWRERLEPGAEHATEVTAFVSRDIGGRWQLVAYGLKGFTNASPDVGVGAHLSYKF
ncbi:MAG TPA: hypothetical protein VEB66_06525 [Opitutaceae bacterium]|nr:hypothetical protein [Opitutaceae bacterium]